MKVTTLQITDDLDGSPDALTYALSFDGPPREIDLSQPNAAKLQKLLAPYLDVSRPAQNGGKTRRAPQQRGKTSRTAAGEIRQWWKDNPTHLPTWQARGAIPATVLTAYQQRDQTQTPVPPVADDIPAPKRRGRKPKTDAG